MKRITLYLLITLLAILPCNLLAQQQKGKFSPQEFKNRLEAFITDKAGLSQSEAQTFFPIFHEMKDKQRQMQGRIFQLKKERPTNDAQDKEYYSKVLEINKLKVQMAQVEADYYKKLCKVVSPTKVYKAMNAEDWFHMDMLRNFNPKGPSGQKGRSQRK